jgi:hypothetical protein
MHVENTSFVLQVTTQKPSPVALRQGPDRATDAAWQYDSITVSGEHAPSSADGAFAAVVPVNMHTSTKQSLYSAVAYAVAAACK